MAIDVFPRGSKQTLSSGESLTAMPSPASGGTQPESIDDGETSPSSSRGRWIRRSVIGVGMIAAVASAGAIIPATLSMPSDDSMMTHSIGRSDLSVSVIEQGTLESSENTEVVCKVRGFNTVTWVIENGSIVNAGDELVRLDTKVIEEEVSLTKTNTHIAQATLERSKADVAKSEIAIDAYLKGRYRSQLKTLERELEIAKSNLQTAQKVYDQANKMFWRGYITELEVQSNAFAVTQAELELKVKETELDVLQRYTKDMEMETLNGNLTANRSKLEADKAGLAMDTARRDRAIDELENCVIRAERSGLVIYPSAAAWKSTPDITEGANVRKDQVLLLMPDLSKMQVKVGIHESIVDRVKKGLVAKVTLPDRTLYAKVSYVASITRPAGWWTGNVVKYDTIIDLPADEGLKPGMSAEVEIILATHKDVLTIPVAAVVATNDGDFCWVKSSEGTQRRKLQLGDSNDVFIVVESGLEEGDEVVLNPMSIVKDAQTEALKTIDEAGQGSGDTDVASEPVLQQESTDVD